jgi:hypothetical protein
MPSFVGRSDRHPSRGYDPQRSGGGTATEQEQQRPSGARVRDTAGALRSGVAKRLFPCGAIPMEDQGCGAAV